MNSKDLHNWSDTKKALLEKLLQGNQQSNSIPKAVKKEYYPLSLAQKRIWFLEELMPNESVFNVPFALKIEGKISIDALETSIQKLQEKHQILNTQIFVKDGEPYQRIINQSIPLTVIHSKTKNVAINWAEEEAKKVSKIPFDLHKDAYARFYLYEISEEEHLLVMVFHHIICDGWSFGVLFNDFGVFYKKSIENKLIVIDKEAIQYIDFAVWQNEETYINERKQHITYWEKVLGKSTSEVYLPFRKTAFDLVNYEGKRNYFKFDTALTEQLNTFAKKHKVTLHILLISIYKLLYYFHTNTNNLRIGIPIANRKHTELEGLVGFLVNTLVIKTDVDKTNTFLEFLANVKTQNLEAYKHQEAPFEKVIEAIQPERNLGHSQLFNSMFIFQNAPMKAMSFDDFKVSSVELFNGDSQFEFSLTMAHFNERLHGFFEYQTALFSDEAVENFAKQFEQLARAILVNEKETISALKEAIIPKKRVEKKVYTIAQRFEDTAMRFPENTALVYNNETFTYSELNDKANALAYDLINNDVKQGSYVGIYTEKSLELVIGILAILKVGAAYVPLDPINPVSRLKLILNQTEVNHVLIQPHLQESFNKIGKDINKIFLDKGIKGNPVNPSISVNEEQLGYIMFTSGSTGKPKGVMVSNKNVCRLFDATINQFNFNEQDVWTLFHSFAFDFSVWELWGALLYGGKLVVVDYEQSRNPTQVLSLIQEHGVTIFNQTPSSFYQIIEQNSANEISTLGNLRKVIFGGEALNYEKLQLFLQDQKHQKVQLHNMYGITETTVHVTNHNIYKEQLTTESVIGKPIDDLKVYILDEQMKEVAVGVEGELYVDGAGISLGYLDMPIETAVRFVPNPYGETGTRLFKTGDRGYVTAKGTIVYKDRIDNQIQLRGYRIELDEIKTALLKNKAIKDVAVTFHKTDEENAQIIGYVIPNQDEIYTNTVAKVTTTIVHQWEAVFNKVYEPSNSSSKNHNFIGWDSSYTGKAIPKEEMLSWLEDTLNNIKKLTPENVLEIGCGTGMLLLDLIEEVKVYQATDLSEEAINYVQSQLATNAKKDIVALSVVDAVDSFQIVKEQSYDCFILNSVAQYFPSAAYLENVLEQAIDKASTTTKFFIGDVRSIEFQKDFYRSIIKENTIEIAEELAIQQLKEQDNELVLSPTFFKKVQEKHEQITAVEILVKASAYWNEMSRFRYDAVLHSNITPIQLDPNHWIVWNDASALKTLETKLKSADENYIGFANVPNARLTEFSTTEYSLVVDPYEAVQLGKKYGYDVKLYWSNSYEKPLIDYVFYKSEKETKDLVFEVYPVQPEFEKKEQAITTSGFEAEWEQFFKSSIKKELEAHIPGYMIPSSFYVLEKFSLTPNGKINYNELPVPERVKEFQQIGLQNKEQLTETEELLLPVWKEILGKEFIHVNDNFFELGGHSLQAAKLIYKVKDILGIDFPLRHLFLNSSIRGMASVIDQIRKVEALGKEYIVDEINLEKEAVLPDDIQIPEITNTSQNKTIFFTGTTGFIGAFLLRELLDSTSLEVICLVRARDKEHALERIQTTMESYEIWDAGDLQRIKPLVGDLELPYFGLTTNAFEALADKVDTILHNGALVNFVYPYHELKKANINGTETIIRLASTGRTKHLHYMSTIFAFSQKDFDISKMVYEYDIPKYWEDHRMGYTQTKWVAEQLVLEANNRGLPVTIHRPGRVLGSSKTGVCQENDFLWKMIKASIQLEKAPNMNTLVDMTPVDFFAEFVVACINDVESTKNVYHVFNIQAFTLKYFLDWIHEFGYKIDTIHFNEWQDLIIEEAQYRPELAVNDLLPLFLEKMEIEDTPNDEIDADTVNYERALQRYKLETPAVENKILTRYFDYFIKTGYLPEPIKKKPITV